MLNAENIAGDRADPPPPPPGVAAHACHQLQEVATPLKLVHRKLGFICRPKNERESRKCWFPKISKRLKKGMCSLFSVEFSKSFFVKLAAQLFTKHFERYRPMNLRYVTRQN